MKTIALALAALMLTLSTMAPASAGPQTYDQVFNQAERHER